MDSKAIGYISKFVQGSVFNVYMNLLRVTRGILKDNILQHTAESHYFEHSIAQHSIAYVAFYVSACHQCQTNCNRWSSACIDATNYLLTESEVFTGKSQTETLPYSGGQYGKVEV